MSDTPGRADRTALPPADLGPAPDPTWDALWEELRAEPWRHDFFQLLRRIDALHPKAPRLGTALRPRHEALRLGQAPELDFAPAALAGTGTDGAGVPRLLVRFFGLLGPNGPMPLHFTDYVRERAHNAGDATLQRFLDVFHHRMLALFYRAWAHTQPVVHRDRPTDDRYAAWLGATIGLDAGTAGRDAVPDAAKLHMAGLLGARSRHPEGLRRLLSHHFGIDVQVQERVPHWLPVHANDRSRLGGAGRTGGARIGVSAVAGSRVWDRQSRFRLLLGPLSLERYRAFLPGRPAWRELVDWVHLYAGRDLLWDARLCLRGPEVPTARLGRHVRLGLTSWSGCGRRKFADRDNLCLKPTARTIAGDDGGTHG